MNGVGGLYSLFVISGRGVAREILSIGSIRFDEGAYDTVPPAKTLFGTDRLKQTATDNLETLSAAGGLPCCLLACDDVFQAIESFLSRTAANLDVR